MLQGHIIYILNIKSYTSIFFILRLNNESLIFKHLYTGTCIMIYCDF